jgi:hypothetical protein
VDVISPSILFFPRTVLMPKYVGNLLAVALNPAQNSDHSAMYKCQELELKCRLVSGCAIVGDAQRGTSRNVR